MHQRYGPPTTLLCSVALGIFAACAATPAPQPALSQPAGFTDLERQVVRLVNEYRIARGLARLTYDTAVARVARAHSIDMAAGRVPMGHDGFNRRADAVERIERFDEIAENVALNDYARERTVAIALRGWLGSAHHLENIEGAFTVTGVGVARAHDGTFYYTQIFVARR
jgi:uncharacterized protein YkwD